MQENTKRDYKNRRSINGQMRLMVPKKVIEEKCQKYMKDGKAKHRAEMLNESEFSIMSAYQSEYRGIVEYYQLAHNITELSKLKWIMDHSLTMTLAAKLKTYASKVRKKYNTTLTVEGKPYKGMQITIEREGKKPLVAQWGGIPLRRREKAVLNDNPQTQWGGHTELVKRMMAHTCEQCGSKEQVEVHHIRAMKDLNKYTGREKPEWVKKMALRNRKTLILCRTCHMDLHAGRPMTRPKVKFTNMTELESRMQ